MSRAENQTKEAALEAILRYIQSSESAPIWSEWYIGTTPFITERLYKEHKASYTKSFYVTVESAAIARDVEKYFIDQYRMDGRPDKSDSPRYVYVFKKLVDTDPPLKLN